MSPSTVTLVPRLAHSLSTPSPHGDIHPIPRRSQPRPAPASYMESFAVSLDRLSSELVTLVCEQLCTVDYRSLVRLRRVSRRFDAISTPVVYRRLELTQRLAHPNAEFAYPGVARHIAQFTKEVEIHGSLDSTGIRRVLGWTGPLATITWRYEAGDLEQGGEWLPADVLNLQHMQEHKTCLLVEDLPMRQFNEDAYIRAVPSESLVSLKLASPTPPLTTRLGSLKRLLLQSRNLKVLHYQDRGQGTQFQFQGGERMPAVRDLSLRSYDWNHDKDEVRKHWDFSQLRSLELLSVPYFNFLDSVSLPVLSGLTSLHIEDWSTHLPDRRREATEILSRLVRHHIRKLESLETTCHTEIFEVDAILQHHTSLQKLRLRDHVGFGDEGRRCPTLHSEDVARLGRHMSRLTHLDLDMDDEMCDPDHFVKALLEFPALEYLTLHVQTLMSVSDDSLPEDDEDYEAAMHILGTLARGRQRLSPDRPWKNITINVGGWRPVMIRRLSPAWRTLNDHGIFAERCFVLSRIEGQYNIREEMSTESSSSRATPEL